MQKLNNVAIVIFGLLFIVGSSACLWASSLGRSEYRRWQAAAVIQEPDALASAGQGADVALVGAIAPETPAAGHGLALYQVWERKVGYRSARWEQAQGYVPSFELLLLGADDQRIPVQGEHISLLNTQEVGIDVSTKANGLAPGAAATILGTAASLDGAWGVRAEVICGGGLDACRAEFSSLSATTAIVAAVLILGGLGLVWLGIRRLRT